MVWQLPVVFAINNNQWASSVPRSLQSAAQRWRTRRWSGCARRAGGRNDVLAVYDRVKQAIETRARAGRGEPD